MAGAAEGVENGALITLGTSVGGELVLNGHLMSGRHFQTGQVSAMVTNFDEPTPATTVGATTSAVKMIEDVAVACKIKDAHDGWAVFEKIDEGDDRAWPIFSAFAGGWPCC